MDISNSEINSELDVNNTQSEPNDISNVDNLLEEYITNILNHPLHTTPSQNVVTQPLFTNSNTTFERDPTFRIMNQLFTTPRPRPRYSRYVPPYNPQSNILFQSLNEGPVYKKILSEKGEDQLNEIKFSDTDQTNDTCPIFQTTFDNDDMVIQLPCEHIFTPDAIKKWLSQEQAICPVCRFELDSKEIKIKKRSIRRSVSNSEDDETDSDSDMSEDDNEGEQGRHIARSRIALIRSLASLASNTQISTGTTGFSMIDQEEEDDLQAAIYASLQESNSN